MKRGLFRLVLIALLAGACSIGEGDRPRLVSASRMLMGTTFRIQLVTPDADAGNRAIEAALNEVARVEELLSEWKQTSQISAVNRAAGQSSAVAVGPELFDVVERGLEISELTAGAFDMTYASCGHLWSFRDPRIPSDAEIAACLPFADYRRVELDPGRRGIRLPDASMRIGISGIGKGYGVDRAADLLDSLGFTDYTVDGGGDLRVSGDNIDRPWRVGVADPRQPGALTMTLEPHSGAVVTSGDYHLFFELDGKRYHHIVDPSTGRPAERSIAVTVIAESAMDADALATGLFVLGPQRGLELVERLPGVEAMITAADGTPYSSFGFPKQGPN